MKKLRLFSSVFLIVGLFLAACGGTPAAPKATEVGPAAPTPGADSNPVDAASGVLRIALQPMVQTDPALISSDTEVLVASHVYDYLVDVDASSKIIPRLAKSWTISPDGRTYTFTLEQGVTFHDGSALQAADVVWTFDRLRAADSGFPTADLYANINTIEAPADNQVVFQLKQPNPFFLFDLSDNHALILKADTTDPAQFNGTGPFRVGQYSPEDRIVLEANPAYWLEGQPELSSIEVIFFNDDTAMVDALRGGQVDLVMRLPTPLFASLQNEAGITAQSIPSNKFEAVRLRADREPGSDPRVMQALRLATDRQALFDLVQQGQGAVGRDSPIGPMYPAYFSTETPLPERDVEAARRLLADAGYEDGLDLVLHTPDTENRPDLAVALQSQWAEAGINIEVQVEPESVYYGDNGWLEVDLGITGWGSRPYPQFYLDVMLVCNAKWNEAHWCDAEFDELARTAGTTLEENERVEAYARIQQILIERGPVIIPFFSATNAAIRSEFVNFAVKPFPGRTDLRGVSLGQ